MRRSVTNRLVPAIALLLALSSVCWAQATVPRVGVLALREGAGVSLSQLFERSLTERGWIPGKTVIFEYAYPQTDQVLFEEAAAELVRKKVDLIYATSAPGLRAAVAATRIIPIVAADYSTDPVAAGFVESYGHPGKNVTGIFLDAPEFAGKWIQILKEINPKLLRIAVLWDPSPGKVHLLGVQSAAKKLRVQFKIFEIRKPEDIDKAFASFRKRFQAVIELPSPLMYAESTHVAQLAKQHKLLGISIWRRFSESGGAVTYGPHQIETHQRAAALVDRILRGDKVAQLPIERPMRFEFLLNMKTIKALNLKVPDAYLVGAEEVGG